MAKAPAFQLYAGDFYVGTAHFSGAEVGAYIRGLTWSWDNGPLPADHGRLARVLLIDAKEFRRVWPAVSEKWELGPDGYTNQRLESVRQEQVEFRAHQSDKGKAGAAKRWGKQDGSRGNGTGIAAAMTAAIAGAQPGQWPDDSSSVSNLHSSKKIKSVPRKRAEPAEGFDVFWDAYPLKVSKAAAVKAWNRIAPDQRLRDRIHAAIHWQRDSLTFVKDGQVKGTYPATWLNGERWNDERPGANASNLPAPQPDYDRDWFTECKEAHGGTCEGQYKHKLRMQFDPKRTAVPA